MIFLDTGFRFAYMSEEDKNHDRVCAVVDGQRGRRLSDLHFARHRDQSYSFVDSLSFVMMEKLGIREAWAVDRDFTHRFVASPGPL